MSRRQLSKAMHSKRKVWGALSVIIAAARTTAPSCIPGGGQARRAATPRGDA